ncbi:Two component system response regulator [Desulfonema limicola]|uniref:Two component system response regulator n=1 Tax=Desulfonema limicola TaxID=45656 RepID=A0A975BCV0_9BACT|nr:response regulator [Desulfonema limicola]QTA83026.1 Two component system response regulator [Desulfonema limicola]
MKKNYKILIADRNPHVRKFLKREMSAAGYQVQLAETGHEVLRCVYADESLDLLILDTDLPDTDEAFIMQKLQNRLPYLPMILHTFPFDEIMGGEMSMAKIVEKSGSSVEQLKKAAFEILNRNEKEYADNHEKNKFRIES